VCISARWKSSRCWSVMMEQCLWDFETRSLQRTLADHAGWVFCVAYSPYGNQIASAGDKTVHLWNAESGECRSTSIGHGDRVSCVTCSQTGDVLAPGSRDRMVRLRDVATGQCRAVVQNFQDTIRCCAEHSSGK
jgi:WD40 repeat protein